MSKNKTKKAEIRIDVGGGLEPLAGFTNVDLYAEGPGIVKAPAWDLPYETGTVDEVNCSHVLEHVEKRKVLPVLCEFYRVLRPGGLLSIEVPDLAWCCQNFLQNQTDGWNLDAIFGNQDPPGGQFHLTGFTPATLTAKLQQAGFTGHHTMWQPFTHNQTCIHIETCK